MRRDSVMQPTAYALERYKSFKPAMEMIEAATDPNIHASADAVVQHRTLRIWGNPLLELALFAQEYEAR